MSTGSASIHTKSENVAFVDLQDDMAVWSQAILDSPFGNKSLADLEAYDEQYRRNVRKNIQQSGGMTMNNKLPTFQDLKSFFKDNQDL